jgi:hypothetical protein
MNFKIMINMKNIISGICGWFAVIMLTLSVNGCTLLGLDMQEDFDLDFSPLANNQLGVSGWEFIRSRPDLFQYFMDAVEYAGVDSAEFNSPDITIFPVTNAGISTARSTSTGYNAAPGGYWAQHPVNGVVPDRWSAYPKEQVRQFVLNHIMIYAVSYNELLDWTQGSRTFYPTKATTGYGYISLHMLTSQELGDKGGGAIPLIWVNDFPSHYEKLNPNPLNYDSHISPRTCNLQTANGSYVHVMDYFLDFPNSTDLRIVPIFYK